MFKQYKVLVKSLKNLNKIDTVEKKILSFNDKKALRQRQNIKLKISFSQGKGIKM